MSLRYLLASLRKRSSQESGAKAQTKPLLPGDESKEKLTQRRAAVPR
jgi:hypothetical protein